MVACVGGGQVGGRVVACVTVCVRECSGVCMYLIWFPLTISTLPSSYACMLVLQCVEVPHAVVDIEGEQVTEYFDDLVKVGKHSTHTLKTH